MNQDKQNPPRWAEALLESFCPPESLEEVQGDLAELYDTGYTRMGSGEPTDAMLLIRLGLYVPSEKEKKHPLHPLPASIRTHSYTIAHTIIHSPAINTMLRNYLKIAFRHLFKTRLIRLSTSVGWQSAWP